MYGVKNELGGGLPWQVNTFAGAKGARKQWYKTGMLAAAVGGAAWWWYTSRDQAAKHTEAVERFGRRGEKVEEYGERVRESVQKGDHFPGIPTTETNAPGGHSGGARP